MIKPITGCFDDGSSGWQAKTLVIRKIIANILAFIYKSLNNF
ncbi:hypothetical protein C900_01976 [Fulvivirga imtechensis AK7]|uniref:Uncharacterized protein n=1 Tax=Fulvivirga imtechensis AK7 TaxID=1237149 RepID=L8JSN3_9BACT|nr:hypothetical protein C900_01976 [Fulvivirga imtechensis AK7]